MDQKTTPATPPHAGYAPSRPGPAARAQAMVEVAHDIGVTRGASPPPPHPDDQDDDPLNNGEVQDNARLWQHFVVRTLWAAGQKEDVARGFGPRGVINWARLYQVQESTAPLPDRASLTEFYRAVADVSEAALHEVAGGSAPPDAAGRDARAAVPRHWPI